MAEKTEWKSVPVKPTDEMVRAGLKRMFDEKRYSAPWDDVINLMYCDMVEAAPPPAGAQQAVANRKAWKITVPSGLSHWFTEDDDVVAHFSLPDQGHKIEEYHLAPVAAQNAAADEREAFLDHWVKDVPEEYRAAARERADKDLLLSLDRGPLRIAADAWQARGALAAPVAAQSERYSFVCNAGCGICGVKVAPFEYERTETLEGEHLGSKYRPHIVSSCCGSEVHVYDNDADAWGAAVTLAATPAPEAAPSACSDERLCVSCYLDKGACEAAPSAKEGEEPMLLATAPEHIWLDLGDDFDGDPATTAFHELGDVTWSKDNASGKGIKYVRVGIEGLTPAGGDS